ncbi:hypothetical protein [Persicobacter sp. CCB-QB2]|uniref:hypothetical protein n=1 Tax=Persicobacter sp. CCB-QB2 TaxID=1561025 RepID=UPI0006A94F24|nr:hypothetical protein [Persicobacter sp. CCB-QB2]
MKRILLVFALILGWNGVQAQEVATDTQDELPKINIADFYHINDAVYRRAMQYNDMGVAKDALYRLITVDPQNDSLLVNLANIYFEQRQWISAVLASKDAKMVNPNNVAALQIEAYGLQYLGVKDKAAEAFEAWYLKTTEKEALYQLALLQLELKKYAECETNVDILLADAEYIKNTAQVEGTEGNQVTIPMEAVLYNLKGVAESIQGNKAEAKKLIGKAVEIAPEFKIAKDRLATL